MISHLRFVYLYIFSIVYFYNFFSFFQPAVSVGNIGQLTCDLLINTLKLTKTGCFSDQSLQPLCGNDAFHSTGIAAGKLVTSAEGISPPHNFIQIFYTVDRNQVNCN